MLNIAGLHKSFGRHRILTDINLTLARGEVHALLGENGAGKSTLVKIISGAYTRDSGRITLDGRDLSVRAPREAMRHGISIMYQETSLVGQLSVIENIFLGIEPTLFFGGILNRSELTARFSRLCERFDYRVNPDRQVSTLPVAEKKIIEILKSLAHDARLIIMDEPTDALSEKEITHLFTIIEKLRANRITILYITHYLDEVKAIADRFTVLRDGRKIHTGAVGDSTKKEIITMMTGKTLKNNRRTQVFPGAKEFFRVENLGDGARVRDVSFAVKQGEILGITGLVGAGKTELARILFGRDPYSEGRTYIEGVPGTIRNPRDAMGFKIGLIPEDRKTEGLLANFTLQENLTLLSMKTRWSVLSFRDAAARACEMVRTLNIKASGLNESIFNLSGGNQQKVVLGKWLLARTNLLIMDEPTRGIDIGAKEEIYEVIRGLAGKGMSILFITSDIQEALSIADRLLIMKNGTVIKETPVSVTEKEVMSIIQNAG